MADLKNLRKEIEQQKNAIKEDRMVTQRQSTVNSGQSSSLDTTLGPLTPVVELEAWEFFEFSDSTIRVVDNAWHGVNMRHLDEDMIFDDGGH